MASDAHGALPAAVHRVPLGEREVFVVGTAHVSQSSVDDVRATLAEVGPDAVCVELCAARLQNLTDRESWRRLDIFKVLREGKAPLLLASLVMSSFQRRIAKQLGVTPGAEMLAAVEWSEQTGRALVLVDRDIQVTLRRTWARLGLWSRIKMAFQFVAGFFVSSDIDEQTVEELKQAGHLGDLLDSLAAAFPTVKETLIDERDAYLAEKIARAPGTKVVAVVGAGHVPGILERLGKPIALEPLEQVPPPSWVPRVLKWAIPIAIVALLGYGFVSGRPEESWAAIVVWLVANSVLSALGAAAALGHPLTVLSAFLAAPLTSLNPMIAAGWVAGLVQAWIKQPTVADLEDLPEAILSVGGFWRNPVSRILLVVALANLGSTLGTVVAGSLIAARQL